MTAAVLERDVVILACAVSAGIHGALVPEHFDEGTGAGVGFVVSTVLLAALAVALTRRPNAGRCSPARPRSSSPVCSRATRSR